MLYTPLLVEFDSNLHKDPFSGTSKGIVFIYISAGGLFMLSLKMNCYSEDI